MQPGLELEIDVRGTLTPPKAPIPFPNPLDRIPLPRPPNPKSPMPTGRSRSVPSWVETFLGQPECAA
jgi:hypothetical protein